MHIHIMHSDGEAKYWLEPNIELARNYRLNVIQLKEIESLIEGHYDKIKIAWKECFVG